MKKEKEIAELVEKIKKELKETSLEKVETDIIKPDIKINPDNLIKKILKNDLEIIMAISNKQKKEK